jgi:aldose 1-epimerase
MGLVTIRDKHSGSHATIAAGRGFNCFEFVAAIERRRVEVLAAEEGFAAGSGSPSHHGIPILFPFPNRIRAGRFSWEGREYQLPLTPGHPHALHGFCLGRAWRVVDERSDSVTGQFQLSVDAPDLRACWPCDFILEVQYTVAGASLTTDVRITNPDETPLPWGFGTHAYFKVPLREGSTPADCLVEVPAQQEWVLAECLPTGERRSVSGLTDLRAGQPFAAQKWDHVLTDVRGDGREIETLIRDKQAGLTMVQSFPGDFREVVVFAPSWTSAVCMEPYTCVTDAINLQQQGVDAGWRTLAPHETFTTRIGIRVGRE